MLTERFTFISLLVLITVSLIVDICLSVASDTPNESVRSVIQTCPLPGKLVYLPWHGASGVGDARFWTCSAAKRRQGPC